MPLIIFTAGEVAAWEGLNSTVEIAEDEGSSAINTLFELSEIGYSEGLSTDISLSDMTAVNTSAQYEGHWFEPKTIDTISFLVHKDFSDFECRYTTFPEELAEQVNGRLNKSMPARKNSFGQYCNNTNAGNTKHCMTATAQDGRVVIIDPITCDVRSLDKFGNIIFNEMFPAGTFETLIGLAADNNKVWCLHWDSTCYHGGNKYIIQARYWDDFTLVEFEDESGVSTEVDIAVDMGVKTSVESKAAQEFLKTTPNIGDYNSLATSVELTTPAIAINCNVEIVISNHLATSVDVQEQNGLSTEVEVQDWAHLKTSVTLLEPPFEVQFPKPDVTSERDELELYDPPESIMWTEEVNERYAHFNTEYDVWYYMLKGSLPFDGYMRTKVVTPLPNHPLDKNWILPDDVNPNEYWYNKLPPGEDIPSLYMQRELGYVQYEGDRPYKQHTTLYRSTYNIDGNGNLLWYYFDPRENPIQKLNCRYVSNPKIVASETKLFFIVTTRRGSFPWKLDSFPNTDPYRRSSHSLIFEVDKTTRKVKQPTNVPMSCAMDVQARDDVGLVMMDAFQDATNDNSETALKGFLKFFTSDDPRKVDLTVYDTTTFGLVAERLNVLPHLTRNILDINPEFQYYNEDWYEYTTANLVSDRHHLEADYEYGCQLRLTTGWVSVCFALTGPISSRLEEQDHEYDHGGMILLMDEGLQGDTILVAPRLPHLLNVSENSEYAAISTSVSLLAQDDYDWLKTSVEVHNIGFETLNVSADLMDYGLQTSVTITEPSGLNLSVTLADRGYTDEYLIVTNNCPIDIPDPGADDINWDFIMRTSGTYRYSTFVWYPGLGEDPNGKTTAAWRFKYKDPTFPSKNFPHPIQYVIDPNDGEIFGLFRLSEMSDPLPSYTFTDPGTGDSYTLGTGEGDDLRAMNYPIGGVLHKYEDILQSPEKSLAMPGYFETTAPGDYDPFVQYRHIGISPTQKRLYVIRAMGRRDYWHYNYCAQQRSMTNRVNNPFDGGTTIYSHPPLWYYDEFQTLWIWKVDKVWLDSSGFVADEFTCDHGVYSREITDYTPIGDVEYTLVDKHYATTDVADVFSSQTALDFSKLIAYDQTENDYTVRDILVYDYEFNFITRMTRLSGLQDDDVIMSVREADGIFYVLTQAKSDPYNWGQFEVDRQLNNPSEKSALGTDKYGWIYKEMRLYKIRGAITNTAQLLYTLPFGTHSSNDVIIQEITKTHVWLNWDAIRKVRVGKVLGLGIRLDGTNHVTVPGLVAIIKDKYEDGEYSLLCYKHPTYNAHRFESSKLTRWGRKGANRLLVLREKGIQYQTEEWLWAPDADAPQRGDATSVLNHVSGMQPGYSQVRHKRQYTYLKTSVTLVESALSAKPRTWVKVTSGGPNTYAT